MKKWLVILLVIAVLLPCSGAFGSSTPGSDIDLRVGLHHGVGVPKNHLISCDGVFSVALNLGDTTIPVLFLEDQEVEITDISEYGFTLLPKEFNSVGDALRYIKDVPEEAHIFFDGSWSISVRDNGPKGISGLLVKGPHDSRGVILPTHGKMSIVLDSYNTSEQKLLKLNGSRFRGKLELDTVPSGGISVVNELPLEEYLYGVLPKEMPASWPMEALKAQAVAARTYAVSNLKKWQKEGFDLKADTSDQAYLGYDLEDARTNLAVDETKGELLFFQNEPISAFYHADSGGMTETCLDAFGSDLPYLTSVKDDFVRDSPNSSWELPLNLTTISRRPEVLASGIGEIRDIEITKKTPAGRVKEIFLGGEKGGMYLTYSQIRSVFSTKSNLFEIKPSPNEGADYLLIGSGYGHGVGLSQWGAKGMAEEGYNYTDILQHYYKNTQLSHLLYWGK